MNYDIIKIWPMSIVIYCTSYVPLSLWQLSDVSVPASVLRL